MIPTGMNVTEKLQRLRGTRSYAEAARAAKCSEPAARDVFQGVTKNPKAYILHGLAQLYGVSLDWLLDDSQDWPPPADDKQRATKLVERALSGAGLAGDLTEDERTLLSKWRSLSPTQRAEVVGYVIGLAAGATSEAALEGGKFHADLDEVDAQLDQGEQPRRRGGGQGA